MNISLVNSGANGMPYLINNDVSGGSTVSQKFDPPVEMRLIIRIDRARELTDEEKALIPNLIRISQRRKKGGVPAIFGMSGGPHFVCQKLKDKIEELSPGKVGF